MQLWRSCVILESFSSDLLTFMRNISVYFVASQNRNKTIDVKLKLETKLTEPMKSYVIASCKFTQDKSS